MHDNLPTKVCPFPSRTKTRQTKFPYSTSIWGSKNSKIPKETTLSVRLVHLSDVAQINLGLDTMYCMYKGLNNPIMGYIQPYY